MARFRLPPRDLCDLEIMRRDHRPYDLRSEGCRGLESIRKDGAADRRLQVERVTFLGPCLAETKRT